MKPIEPNETPNTRLWAGITGGIIGSGADGLQIEISLWGKIPMTGHIGGFAVDVMLPVPAGAVESDSAEGVDSLSINLRLMFLRQLPSLGTI